MKTDEKKGVIKWDGTIGVATLIAVATIVIATLGWGYTMMNNVNNLIIQSGQSASQLDQMNKRLEDSRKTTDDKLESIKKDMGDMKADIAVLKERTSK